MDTFVRIHNESEYNEILHQAVAVIETAKGNAARAIVRTSDELHRPIGQLLYERKLFTKPIFVAEYKLIVLQKKLKQLITDEIKTFNPEKADKIRNEYEYNESRIEC